jgi:hypothetical protein
VSPADATAPAGAQDLFDGEYEPSPVPRIREQVARYEATDGTEGNTLEDRPVVMLTTIGVKSGLVRKNPFAVIGELQTSGYPSQRSRADRLVGRGG